MYKLSGSGRHLAAVAVARGQRDLCANDGVIWRLSPHSEPPEEKQEAQSERKEEAVLGLELVRILPALRRRGGAWPEVTGEGHCAIRAVAG
jgi:hypothetical protein